MIQGRNVYFFDDTETLRQEWSSINFETVGELYVYFTRVECSVDHVGVVGVVARANADSKG
jgi:hypothetical protein